MQGVYTGSAPCGEGKGLIQLMWNCLGFDDQGANPLDLALELLLFSLNRRRVVPLYTQVDARRFTESRPTHKRVRLGFYPFLSYNTSYTPYGGLCLRALIRLWALGF